MNYEKPEIVTLGYAVAVVKGGKSTSGTSDTHLPPKNFTTTNAYEADE